MIIDALVPDANFVSARHIDVAAPAERVWEVLPELPAALRNSRLAAIAAGPLLVASLVRGERGLGNAEFKVDRVDEGREVVLTGRHRLADFATSFYVEPMGADRTRLHNVTRARFKTSITGRLYLAGVHLFHDVYIDWMLRLLRRLAEAEKALAV